MSKTTEIKWYLREGGSGHATQVVRDGSGARERTYIFESLSRDDQIPARLAKIIRQDGRSRASVSYDSA